MILSAGAPVIVQPRAQSVQDPNTQLTGTNIVQYMDSMTGGLTAASTRVNEHSSLGMPAVWRAVNLIASGSASLPLHAYKRSADDPTLRVPQFTGQGADLIANPHPDLTSFELWEIVYSHMLLWGNAYLQKLRDQNGRVKELWPVHPSRVTPRRDEQMNKTYRITGMEELLTDQQILHIPGFGYDGIKGLSPITCARQGIGLALAAEEFGARLFGSGSLAGGILTTEQRLKQDQADALKSRWKAKVGGLHNSHEIAILDAGAKFQQLTIPPEDAQFIESRG